MAPADSLARLRKALMDRAARREAPVTQLCAEAGISRSRFYELRARYTRYGEAGLRPKPRPAERHVRQHRIPPRSPNLNAFVERFQGTVLHLHYRVAFRYRYYTSITTIDADLGAFLRFYNFERPHRGYRTKGRTPASIFFSQEPEFLSQMGA